MGQLQCNATRTNPTAKNSKLMAAPCMTSALGAVRVWATARSEDFAAGGVQAASSAISGTGPPLVSACPGSSCTALLTALLNACFLMPAGTGTQVLPQLIATHFDRRALAVADACRTSPEAFPLLTWSKMTLIPGWACLLPLPAVQLNNLVLAACCRLKQLLQSLPLDSPHNTLLALPVPRLHACSPHLGGPLCRPHLCSAGM